MAMNPNSKDNLADELAELRSRVLRIEDALKDYGIAMRTEEAEPSPEPEESTLPVSPVLITNDHVEQRGAPPSIPETAERQPNFRFTHPDGQQNGPSLESRIGSQWFNRIGILALLIGMAWFLKLAIDNQWIGPLGRVLIGLVAGAGLIAWSERFRGRGYTAFSYSLKAVGSGILYLSIWAAFSLFQLLPSTAAFAAMILVTAFNGFMAWVQDSELLALYAIVGGLGTPLLVSTGENHEVALFSYLLMLDVAVLVLVALRPWSRLLFAAFAGTVIFFLGWWSTFYTDEQSGRTACFLGLFFLIFAFAPRLIRLGSIEDPGSSAWDKLALILLPVANACLGFLGFYALLDSSGKDWFEPWLAVLFAAFYLLLLRLPPQGRLRESPASLSALHLAAAVVFLTIAIPLKAHGRWLIIGWLAEGAALLWVARSIGSNLLRVLALLCLALGLGALVVVNPPAATMPVFNQRFATFLFGIAVFAFVAWLALRAESEADSEPPLRWPALAAGAVLVVNGLILLAISWEIHSFWWLLRWHGDIHLVHDYQMYAQFTYSAFFMIFGAVLLALGFWRASSFFRWQALLLLAVAIGKVFLVDVSELSQGYRILSFLGMGALLLAVSYVYQRDWLRLRATGGPR